MPLLTLTLIQAQLNFYGYLILMIFGIVGNVLIITLFINHRQNACSIYILTLAIINCFYLTFLPLAQLILFSYDDQSMSALAYCKIRFYLTNVLGQIAKTMLILACVDRFMITNDRVSFRAFSTPRQAKFLIFFSVIFWFLIYIHVPIMITVVNGVCGMFGIYSTVFAVCNIIFVGLIPPLILGIFGYLTYRNMRQIHVRVQPIVNNTISVNIAMRRLDRDLLIVVISEVIVYVVTTTPYTLIILEMMISRFIIPTKTIEYLQIEAFVFTIAFYLLFVNHAASFYIYLISSKSFRRDFKQLVINCYRKLRRQPFVQVVSRVDRTLTKRETRL